MEQAEVTPQPRIVVESNPTKLIAARYDELPLPHNGPMQEIAFDLGITALGGEVTLVGMVVQGYDGHQVLFEQRWPMHVLQQRTGERLAVRSLQFWLHGYAQFSHVAVTVIAKPSTGAEMVQEALQIPVVYPAYKTDLYFPLRGAWWAIQAADWSDYHKSEVFSQTYALDFVKLGPDNLFFRGTGQQLADHYSWNQPVYATAGGKVAYVAFDLPDLPPGTPPNPRMFRDDPRRLLGNAVAISHGNGEFSYFAHLQQASLQVNEGELIRRGTLIGRVGNSGQSPGPHLHFHLMEGPNIFIDQGLPVKFSHFSAGGQFFEKPMTIPTRMIVLGPDENT
jgi:Peptidase family M23